MKINKNAPLRALLYATGTYLMVYPIWELRPQDAEGWNTFTSMLAAGCLIVLGTFAQACSELHRKRVPGNGVLNPDLAQAQPSFIESQLGSVSMTSFVRRRP